MGRTIFALVAVAAVARCGAMAPAHVEMGEAASFAAADCSSCVVTIAELLDAVAAEKPAMRVEIGMMGKSVAYGVSEVRAATLLEDLCGRMEPYRLMVDAVREAGLVVREVPYLQKLGSVALEDLKDVRPPYVEVLAKEGVNVVKRPFGEPDRSPLAGGGDVPDLTKPEFSTTLPQNATMSVLTRRPTHAGDFYELSDGSGWVLDDDPEDWSRTRRLALHALKTDGGARAARLRFRLQLKCEAVVENSEARLIAAMKSGVSWADTARARDLVLDACVRAESPSCASESAVDGLPPHTADRYPPPPLPTKKKKKRRKKKTTSNTGDL